MSVQIRVLFLCFFSFCISTAGTAAQLYDMPFKGEDLRDDERVYWGRAIHSSGGVQKYGYDLDVRRYDTSAKRWVAKTGANNKDWIVYGKPVYAMRSGKVIACWRNAPENPAPFQEHSKIAAGRIYGGGNGFWIEHPDGTRLEYAHFIPGTVPGALCPHNNALLPGKIQSPDVRFAWKYIRVPKNQQATVKRGQFLGKVGNAGTSSNPHLHMHLEEGGRADDVKQGGTPKVINFRRGLFAKFDNKGPYVKWRSFARKPIPPGPVLVWPARTVTGEYARHSFPADRYPAIFAHLADSGFWPEWIDVYNVGGRDYVNQIWRRTKGNWRAYHLVDGTTYQKVVNDAIEDGFSPVLVESSVSRGKARYTVIFIKNRPGVFMARHGLNYNQHKAQMNAAKSKGLSPVNISVISLRNKRYYTVLYRSHKVGGWQVKSQIPENQYQAVYEANAKAGRRPIYLNAYVHNGKPFISAIFAQKSTGPRKDRHLMTSSKYQSEWRQAVNAGMKTRSVTSFDGAKTQHRFAAVWWK